jgi:predicted TIM-barrel fold metal-dependent hydrolase
VVRRLVERRMIGEEVPLAKLTWGSDSDLAHMGREPTGWMEAFQRLGLGAADQDAIFWRNAAAIFGVPG